MVSPSAVAVSPVGGSGAVATEDALLVAVRVKSRGVVADRVLDRVGVVADGRVGVGHRDGLAGPDGRGEVKKQKVPCNLPAIDPG